MNFKKQLSKLKNIYFLSFLVPFVVMMIVFAFKKIFPFGDRSFLHVDMYHQYYPFMVELYHKVRNGENLYYSWNTGLGSNFLSLYVYYLASPTNWICMLLPESAILEYMTYLVVIKIGLCGSAFSFYIKKHYNSDHWSIILFATFYALSGYMAAYNWNTMWLDCIVIAPVVIYGLEDLVKNGKPKLYCLSLGFSILTNYYLSIMLCLFLILYFLVLLFDLDSKYPHHVRRLSCPGLNKINNDYIVAFFRFGIYSILGGGLAAVLLIPELWSLKYSEFTSASFPTVVESYFAMIEMLARHCYKVTVHTGLDHWPNIYCGVAVFLLVPLYIMQKDIPVRTKAPRLALLGFLLISFSTNQLNFIWHGMNYPDSLPARQSHLYIFLVLVLAYEALSHIKEFSSREFMGIFTGVIIFLMICEKLITDSAFTNTCFLFSGLFIIGYVIIMHFYRKGIWRKDVLALLAIVLAMIEAGCNTYYTSVPTIERASYFTNYDEYNALVDRTIAKESPNLSRIEKFSRRTQNDAMFIGYPSASIFSSTLNGFPREFYKKYGMKDSKVFYCYDGSTPLTAAMLNVEYMISEYEDNENDVFTLVDSEGNLNLYKTNYTTPFGYMVPSYLAANIENVAQDIKDGYSSGLNPLDLQNNMIHDLGIDGDLFIPVVVNNDGTYASIEVSGKCHIYAYTNNSRIDNIQLTSSVRDKTFDGMSNCHILDLGEFDDGSYVSLSTTNGENICLMAYVLNNTVLQQYIEMVNREPFIIDNRTDHLVEGHIYNENAGNVVFSIPFEPGWKVYVDGKEASIELYETTFISTYLTSGQHNIRLVYRPAGLTLGIFISLFSIIGFVVCCVLMSKFTFAPLPPKKDEEAEKKA